MLAGPSGGEAEHRDRGLAAAGLLAGIFGGVAVGGKLEEALDTGLPVDELHVVHEDVSFNLPREIRRALPQVDAPSSVR